MNATASITQDILQRCRSLGFALAGVTRAKPTDFAEKLRGWLDRGEHGEMAYMAQNLEVRLDPRALLPGAQSIICVADRYSRGGRDSPSHSQRGLGSGSERATAPGTHPPPNPLPQGRGNTARGRIARYARGDDYHVVMKKRLHALCDGLARQFPEDSFRACVDTAPLFERELAAKAGLGAIGKNTMLIAPGSGSYLLLGEVLTTLVLEPSCGALDVDPCSTCTRCIDACPTDAITPWNVNATKCISYLTIEHRSIIDEQYHEAMGDWIFGCDICQEVCPHNQPTRRKRRLNEVHPAYEARRRDFDLLEVLNWDEQARREAFLRSSMKRAKLAMMKRNSLIAAGNWLERNDDVALRARIAAIAGDANEDVMVRETARVVLRRLNTVARASRPCE